MVIAGKSQRVLRYVYYLTEETIDTMNKLQAQGVNVTHINIVFDALNINIQAHGCALCKVAGNDILFINCFVTYTTH